MRRPGIVDIEGIQLSQTANLMVDPHDAPVKDSPLHRSGTENPDGAVAEEGTSESPRVHQAGSSSRDGHAIRDNDHLTGERE